MYIIECGNATHPVYLTVQEGRWKFPLTKTQLDCYWSLVASPNHVGFKNPFHINSFSYYFVKSAEFKSG